MTATHRADASTAGRPVTLAGRHLRAAALNERADGASSERDPEVYARAFTAVVRLRFRPDAPVAAIAAAVTAAAHRHPVGALPVREAEMLIREALGESVPTAGITGEQATAVHVLMFAALVDELALTDDELDELIADAETP